MKNIQIIDGADNCSYSLYSATDEEFLFLFPEEGQDIEFIEDVVDRSSEEKIEEVLVPLWNRPVDKASAQGIHGTLFYQLRWKKKFYPTKKEKEMSLAVGRPGRE